MMKQTKGAGPDFDLPDEVLAVIPTDPYDQLDLARKITSMAIASRVSNLESEVARLRQKMQDKDRLVLELEDQVSQLSQAYHEADTRLKISHDDNTKLRKERDSLAMTVKRLGRDLGKLETFKRQLMQSLNDDNSSTTETVDIVTYDHSVLKPYAVKDEEVNGYTASHSFSSSTESEYVSDASKQAVQRYSLTPYITPRLTPTGTPKNPSTTGSPIRYSGAGSPRRTSNIPSPTRPQRIGSGTLSSWYPSSQQSSGASSPHRLPVPGRTPRIDGKEFFRQARNRLSYEQFSAFLANIKEFNAQKQSREETLRKAEEIFGLDNRDLYLSFQGLLNRNGH
ncbi:uncharacterized protein At4g15545-like [Diospyros lotus]|uniref:uncharacterized protein At4g15545-like n=1 Tax=Diospyros lotus TaxID=55363 RepID=UPI0022506988|nr:uncharacterized protein At4g15545-like [Diospyros lotus]XP_052207614.1 uncharacterized protein At4g15545-like [Diospyros lotus]